jgi:hypothetical protein
MFKPVGLSPDLLSNFDTTRVNDAIRLYVGQSMAVECRVRQVRGLYFAFIKIPAADFFMAYAEHPEAGLFKGRIYIRTDAARSEEIQDPLLLQEMLKKAAIRGQ